MGITSNFSQNKTMPGHINTSKTYVNCVALWNSGTIHKTQLRLKPKPLAVRSSHVLKCIPIYIPGRCVRNCENIGCGSYPCTYLTQCSGPWAPLVSNTKQITILIIYTQSVVGDDSEEKIFIQAQLNKRNVGRLLFALQRHKEKSFEVTLFINPYALAISVVIYRNACSRKK